MPLGQPVNSLSVWWRSRHVRSDADGQQERRYRSDRMLSLRGQEVP
jgi:hypothetical protein